MTRRPEPTQLELDSPTSPGRCTACRAGAHRACRRRGCGCTAEAHDPVPESRAETAGPASSEEQR